MAPPFESVSNVPLHRHVEWVLQVTTNGPLAGLESGQNVSGAGYRWKIDDSRSADVPTPYPWPWTCRIDHTLVLGEEDPYARPLFRDLRCSNDGWATFLQETATVFYGNDPSVAYVKTYSGDRTWMEVAVIPCLNKDREDCQKVDSAPELP